MKSQYEKDYDNLLQGLRDKEDEAAQKERKAEKTRMKKLRDLSRLLDATIRLEKSDPKKRHSVDLERLARAKACGRFYLSKSK
jgi:hypothetical protein